MSKKSKAATLIKQTEYFLLIKAYQGLILCLLSLWAWG